MFRQLGTRLQPHRYDYIVVGAGSAGCTVASRLTERSDANVLLLEAAAKKTGVNRDQTPRCLLRAWLPRGSSASH